MKFIWLSSVLVIPLCAEESIPMDTKEAAYPALERFVKVLETARERHPDIDKVTYDRMVNHALDGMLSSLDRHSSFIHPEMKQMLNSDGSLNNEIRSLGISLGKTDNGFKLVSVEKNGPADDAGIMLDSEILKIDDTPIQALDPSTVLEMLSRPAGERTKLTLKNPNRPGEIEVSVTHRFIEQGSLTQSRLLKNAPETGYLRLAEFGPNCAREVEAALDELEDKGMRSLALDLRGNGGGDLHETVKILGLFVPPSTSVVSVRERGKPEEFLKTPDRQRRKREYPIAVLIDRNSASASELTAGALHDLERATIIGEKSYGKGSVQNIIPMGANTALRLTIATYHTPSGNTPHRKGIQPEITIDFTESDRENFTKTTRFSSLPEKEKAALAKWKDPAISAALKTFEN